MGFGGIFNSFKFEQGEIRAGAYQRGAGGSKWRFWIWLRGSEEGILQFSPTSALFELLRT